MKENSRKKVVIIDDVFSDTIEQAIFILRSGGAIEKAPDAGNGFLSEAQSIINAYAHTVERANEQALRRERKSCKKGSGLRRATGVVLSLFGATSAIWLTYRLFSTMLQTL